MASRRINGIHLPQSLLDEIKTDNEYTSNTIASRKIKWNKSKQISRKEARRLERQTTKQKKQQFFSRSGNSKRNFSLLDSSTQSEGPQRKKQKVAIAEHHRHASPLTQPISANDNSTSSHGRKPERRKKLSSSPPEDRSVDVRHFQVRDDHNDEDAYIDMLEAKLGINKKTRSKDRYGAAFADDNLMDLLIDLDSSATTDNIGENEKPLRGERHRVRSDDFSESSHTSDQSQTEQSSMISTEETWRGLSPAPSELPNQEIVTSNAESSQYIPPQRRQQALLPDGTDEKLLRHMKGLLNRLSEQNIATIIKEIETSYQKWTRHAVTSTLTAIVIESICTQSTLSDSYMALYASLVACMYNIVGIEFAANFLQQTVARYEQLYNGIENKENTAEDEKSCLNVMTLLAELYNFQVTSCLLMYDLVRDILRKQLREIDIELLLKISRNTGAQLHKDDASALEDIVRVVQNKLSTQEGNSSFRMRFLAETLTEVKNKKNKRSVIRSESEMTSRLKKFISGLNRSYQVKSHEPLRVSLEDIRSAETKGKWWLVGAAWGGDPLAEHAVLPASESEEKEETSKLWKAARKQGMNTDIRRSVFVVLMTSDDYMDASDRLTQLNLSDAQQREFIRVLLHCCGIEKSYNPYYTLIGQELCRSTYSHRITLQYCLWDFLRDLGENDIGGADSTRSVDDRNFTGNTPSQSTRISNIAKAFGWWIAKDAIDITCLKTLSFLSMQPQTKQFIIQLFYALFISMQTKSPVTVLQNDFSGLSHDRPSIEKVMHKCTRVPALRQDVTLFLKADMSKTIQSKYESSAFLSWACNESIDILQSNYTE